ncbi:MAG: hypothetical protein ACRD9R_18615 [Pyrinomonadaceae bacterium]
MTKHTKLGIVTRRELLLVEIERRCLDRLCGAKNRIGLTKGEARDYASFECERCGRRHADALAERDVPEWWEELFVVNLEAVRGFQTANTGEHAALAGEEPEEFVRRLSEEWRRVRAEADGRTARTGGEGEEG